MGKLALAVWKATSHVCVFFLPGEVEESEAIDTLGQLDGPDSPLPTLKGKIDGQRLLGLVQKTTGWLLCWPLSLGAEPA